IKTADLENLSTGYSPLALNIAGKGQTSLDLDEIALNIGETSDNPITLIFRSDGVRFIGNDSRSISVDNLEYWYKFSANQTAFIEILVELLPRSDRHEGVNLDFEIFRLHPAGELEWIEVAGQPGEFDEFFAFQAPETGDYLVVVYLVGEDIGLTTPFEITVIKNPTGEIKEGTSKIVESVGHEAVLNILDYFTDEGYVDPVTLDTQIASLEQDPENFVQGIANTILGLLRAGVSISAREIAAGGDPAGMFDTFLTVSQNLLTEMDRYRMPNGIYMINSSYLSSDPGIGNETTSLTANVNAFMAMIELWQFYNVSIEIETQIGFPGDQATADTLLANANQTLTAILTTFNDTVEQGFAENAVIDDVTGQLKSRGNLFYLESNALFSQILGAYNDSYSSLESNPIQADLVRANLKSLQSDIFNFAVTSLLKQDIIFDSIKPIGLGHEYYNSSDSSVSSSSTILGQVYLMDILTPQVINPSIIPFNLTSLELVSDFAYNILRTFKTENGMIVSQINNSNGNQSPDSNLFEVSLLLNSLIRLGAKWRELGDISNDQLNYDEISRTWFRAAQDILESINSNLYDSQSNSYFAQYDHATGTIYRVDTTIKSNSFVANAIFLDYMTANFPIQVYLETQTNVMVNSEAVAIISINKVVMPDSWIWFNFETKSTLEAHFHSDSIGFSERTIVDLNIFDFEAGFLPFSFEPKKRGTFNLTLDLYQEEFLVLSGSISGTALGEVVPEVSFSDFQIFSDESSFSATLGLVDEEGNALSNLEVKASVFQLPNEIENDPTLSTKYLSKDRTDVSGNVDVKFNIATLIQDFNLQQGIQETGGINVNQIGNPANAIVVPVFLNVSNAATFNLQMNHPIVIPLEIKIARMFAIISPTVLEIIQGSGNDYSFSIDIVNQKAEAVSRAKVFYEVNNRKNSITTDTDGSGTITISGADLISVPPPSMLINFTLEHSSYPNKTLTRPVNVRENTIRINANPVQLEVKGQNFFERGFGLTGSKGTLVSLEVTTEDAFGQLITANVSLQWIDPSVSDYNLEELGMHLSPYTFDLDSSKLDAGEYQIRVVASRSGMNQETVDRLITITDPSFLDTAITALLLYGAWILTKFLAAGYAFVIGLSMMSCPHCNTKTKGNNRVCHSCGNALSGKSDPINTKQSEVKPLLEKPISEDQLLKEETPSPEDKTDLSDDQVY
ncbi:MAG: hypothetical protein ACXAB7_15110, partial [Candidatus Kariarchaeaceae archaeon]